MLLDTDCLNVHGASGFPWQSWHSSWLVPGTAPMLSACQDRFSGGALMCDFAQPGTPHNYTFSLRLVSIALSCTR